MAAVQGNGLNLNSQRMVPPTTTQVRSQTQLMPHQLPQSASGGAIVSPNDVMLPPSEGLTAFFGEPVGGWGPQGPSRYIQDGYEAYKGVALNLPVRIIFNGVFAGNEWTLRALPPLEVHVGEINWAEKPRFGGLLDRTAHRAPPRARASTSRSRTARMERYATAWQAEVDFYRTAAGQREAMAQYTEISISVRNTMIASAMRAILAAPPADGSMAATYAAELPADAFLQLLRDDADMIGVIQRDANGLSRAASSLLNMFATRQVQPNMLVVGEDVAASRPPNMPKGMTMEKFHPINAGDGTVFNFGRNPVVLGVMAMVQASAVTVPASDYRTEHGDVRLFSGDSESVEVVQLKRLMRASGLFDQATNEVTALGRAIFGSYESYGHLLRTHGEYPDHVASVMAVDPADRAAYMDLLRNHQRGGAAPASAPPAPVPAAAAYSGPFQPSPNLAQFSSATAGLGGARQSFAPASSAPSAPPAPAYDAVLAQFDAAVDADAVGRAASSRASNYNNWSGAVTDMLLDGEGEGADEPASFDDVQGLMPARNITAFGTLVRAILNRSGRAGASAPSGTDRYNVVLRRNGLYELAAQQGSVDIDIPSTYDEVAGLSDFELGVATLAALARSTDSGAATQALGAFEQSGLLNTNTGVTGDKISVHPEGTGARLAAPPAFLLDANGSRLQVNAAQQREVGRLMEMCRRMAPQVLDAYEESVRSALTRFTVSGNAANPDLVVASYILGLGMLYAAGSDSQNSQEARYDAWDALGRLLAYGSVDPDMVAVPHNAIRANIQSGASYSPAVLSGMLGSANFVSGASAAIAALERGIAAQEPQSRANMSNRTGRANGASDNSEQSLRALLDNCQFHGDVFFGALRNNIRPPIDFCCVRNAVFESSPAVMIAAGTAGNVFYRDRKFMLGESPQYGTLYGQFTMEMVAAVTQIDAVAQLPYASVSRYVGGMGVDIMDATHENADWYRRRTMSDALPGMRVFAIPPNTSSDRIVYDLADVTPAATMGAGYSAQMPSKISMPWAAQYCTFWGDQTGATRRAMASHEHRNNAGLVKQTVYWRDFCMRQVSVGRGRVEWSVLAGTGPLGPGRSPNQWARFARGQTPAS